MNQSVKRPKTKYSYKSSPGTKMDPISLTKPDQAMSVNEILVRTNSGMPMPRETQPVYTGETYYPRNLDFGEKLELSNALKEHNKEQGELIKAEAVLKADAQRKQRESAQEAQKTESAQKTEPDSKKQ